MRRTLVRIALVLLLLLLVAVIRGATLESRQLSVSPAPERAVDARGAADRFAAALRFETISHSDRSNFPKAEFVAFREYLARTYPEAHAALELEVVAGESLLYTWRGSDPSAAPVVLMGHHDVVPVDAPEAWTHPPFAGVIEEGVIWGRGAIDNKNHVIAILEAVTLLLAEGHRPTRSVYLAFGHDEEVGGLEGAQIIAALLKQRGVQPLLVLDEGGGGMIGAIPGLERPVGLVGIAEKGAANVALVARFDGLAHSSVPPPKTPVGRLASAIDRLEENQRPASITPALGEMFEFLAPDLPLIARVLIANRPFTDPLIRWGFLRTSQTAALVRTTTAATMFEGGPKENIVPARARAVVNFRILPGETIESTVEHVERTIAAPGATDLGEIEIDTYRSRQPSAVSSTGTPGWALLQRTIAETLPEIIVAPWLISGGTDARYYHAFSDSVYGFTASIQRIEDVRGAHGTDERITIENLVRMIRFYARLFENASAVDAAS